MLTTQGFLTIPIGAQPAHIPLGMSEADYKILIKSLELWKPRIVVQTDKSESEEDLGRSNSNCTTAKGYH